MNHNPVYSVIVPVYNRPDEVADLLRSLSEQTCRDFEVILVEDGSTVPSAAAVERYAPELPSISYYQKSNEGRSIARNYGIERSKGSWLIFFDSDCVIPSGYFATLTEALKKLPLDCFGGPDAADDSFSDTQKAINFAMTSFLTTGGIRGGTVSLEKFTPRSFNMGYTREVYDRVGGFREMFSEDIDMSMRIRQAGFRIGLVRQASVFHKRRVSFGKFLRQVYVFGMSRITLKLLYPSSLKAVHTLPALAVVAGVVCCVLAAAVSPWWLLPIGVYLLAVLSAALWQSRSIKVALLAVPASVIQIGGYGCGFIRAWFTKIFLRRGRNVDEEIRIRKGR